MNPNAFASILALAVVMAVMGLLGLVLIGASARNERRMQRRLQGDAAAADADFGDAGARPLVQTLARRGRALDQLTDADGETAALLIQAGWRDLQSRISYYVFQAVTPVILVGLVVLGWIFVKNEYFQAPWVYALLALAVILSILLPRMVLRAIAGKRRQRIRREVPLFVHLLVMLYDAGLSTRQAFSNLVREGQGVLPELGLEIQVALRQIEAGAETSEVLRSLGDALKVDDFTSILGVMRQVDRYGGEIREPLHDALKVIEERMALDLRELVNLISGRMTVVMVLFFFPGLLLFIAGPAFVSILKALKGL